VPAVAELVQPEPNLLTIGQKKYSLKEFNQIYRRNLQTDTLPEKTPSQFIEIFINNQLKISKAEKDGLDTTQAFKEQIATLRNELLNSFMVEKSVNDALIKEAYERLETEVNVAHILLEHQKTRFLPTIN
jgi:peptidyl-prolyl cis-trans isomerase SurA